MRCLRAAASPLICLIPALALGQSEPAPAEGVEPPEVPVEYLHELAVPAGPLDEPVWLESPTRGRVVAQRISAERCLFASTAPPDAPVDFRPGEPLDTDELPADGVRIAVGEESVSICVGSSLVTEYRFRDGHRPFFHPVLGPRGESLTRHWPMSEEVKGEAHDHPHHRGMWFTHGDVNGFDFWHGGIEPARIRLVEIREVVEGPVFGAFLATHEWLDPEGGVVCTDERRFRLYALDGARFFEHEIAIRASGGELRFGDTKEGSMALRLTPALRLQGEVAAGKALMSTGVEGKEVWGKRAAWVDYSGPVGGRELGVALFDHPGNPRHPTWWHARDYGLVAANPFGIHDFERKPAGTGDLVLAKGETLRLRYAVFVHPGGPEEGRVEAVYGAWSGR